MLRLNGILQAADKLSFCYEAAHGNDTASWVPQNLSTYLPDTPQDFGTPIPCLVLHGSASRDETEFVSNLIEVGGSIPLSSTN